MTFIKTISLDSRKRGPVLKPNFCSKGTLCPVHLQDHCLQVLTWPSENILCRNILLFSYSPPQTKIPLCFFWNIHLLKPGEHWVEIRCHCAGEYVDYHLAAEPAPAPSTTAPPPQLSSPHHPGGHHVHQWLKEWKDILFVSHRWSFFGSRLSQYDIQAT